MNNKKIINNKSLEFYSVPRTTSNEIETEKFIEDSNILNEKIYFEQEIYRIWQNKNFIKYEKQKINQESQTTKYKY